jgi:predicted RNase H-like HicB family nuclease
MLRYPMHIQWSADDNAYLAAFHGLPACKAQGDTYEEAARNGREALEAFIEAAKERGEELPEPTELKSMREEFNELKAQVDKLKENVIPTTNGVVRVMHEGLTYIITFK